MISNGISFLTSNEEELIAEDDLFYDKYTELEAEPLTDEEVAAKAEIDARRLDVQRLDGEHALRALIWWLAEGGVIPDGWEVPSKGYLRKIGRRGMERLLEGIEKGKEEAIFEDGWAEFAKTMYRVVVFSKVSEIGGCLR